MLISLGLILAVAIYHASPWILLLLLVAWIPDFFITTCFLFPLIAIIFAIIMYPFALIEQLINKITRKK